MNVELASCRISNTDGEYSKVFGGKLVYVRQAVMRLRKITKRGTWQASLAFNTPVSQLLKCRLSWMVNFTGSMRNALRILIGKMRKEPIR